MTWSLLDAGLNISFPTRDTVIFTLPKSYQPVEVRGKTDYLQLIITFNCEKKKEISLDELDPFTYLLNISSPNTCQKCFDIYSKTVNDYKYYFGLFFLFVVSNVAAFFPQDIDKKKVNKAIALIISMLIGFFISLLYLVYITNSTFLNSIWRSTIFSSFIQILLFFAIWISFVQIGSFIYLNRNSSITLVLIYFVIPTLLIISYNFFFISEILQKAFIVYFVYIIIWIFSSSLIYYISSESSDKLIQHAFALAVTHFLYSFFLYNILNWIPIIISFILIFVIVTIILEIINFNNEKVYLRFYLGYYFAYLGLMLLFYESPNFLEMNLMERSGINTSRIITISELILLFNLIFYKYFTYIYRKGEVSKSGFAFIFYEAVDPLARENLFLKVVDIDVFGAIKKFSSELLKGFLEEFSKAQPQKKS